MKHALLCSSTIQGGAMRRAEGMEHPGRSGSSRRDFAEWQSRDLSGHIKRLPLPTARPYRRDAVFR